MDLSAPVILDRSRSRSTKFDLLVQQFSRRHRMTENILLALSTFPDRETAHGIAHQLVTEKFAACANILPTIESIYRWKGKIDTANEILVFFKLSEDRQSAFQEKLRSLHPCEVPEIIFIKIDNGFPDYLRWVTENCSGEP